MSITYSNCCPVSDRYRETGDCTVKAVAIATNTPYIKAHALLRTFGRKNRKGIESWCWTRKISLEAVKSLGFTPRVIKIPKCTVAKVCNHLIKGKSYIITIRGHTLAIVNGVIQDHTNPAFNKDRQKTSGAHVQCVMEITRTISKNAQRKLARYG